MEKVSTLNLRRYTQRIYSESGEVAVQEVAAQSFNVKELGLIILLYTSMYNKVKNTLNRTLHKITVSSESLNTMLTSS